MCVIGMIEGVGITATRSGSTLERHSENINDSIQCMELRGGCEKVGIDGGGEKGFVVG